jgi:hypothetical protein
VETAKVAADSCYVLQQFLTQLPSIDFREIRGLACIVLIKMAFLIVDEIFELNLYPIT